ncbi:c-type cytochrome biogenesis protein CcmI [Salaquimonas pukyongi]|uniref:c-type cytochrome biogenesis protein CcmI n=1 Tax=Salaquimonas pukyongi TaxID=2712698 RepID=UPI00096B958C|nr:c-type cytochrome biogenesis protein CcmI [Salaquimonas pukyongi]
MAFWIMAIVLMVLAAAFVLVPLFAVGTKDESPADLEKALFKARKAEIENDLAIGRIDADAARAAIAEESRKLIAAVENLPGTTPANLGLSRAIALAAVVCVPVVATAFYLQAGNPQLPDQRLAGRQAGNLENQRIEELVARAEAHLAAKPDDVRGWQVLAPVYTRMGRDRDAAQAWANVLRLDPQRPGVRANLAESMVAVAGGVVTEEASRLFRQELVNNQASAKARFYLAMAKGQEGKHEEAVELWDELISGGTDQSPWMEAAKTFRGQSARLASLAPAQSVQPGPTADQVEQAASMTAEERGEMITAMVQNLAGRLEDNPTDKEGWKRLVRAYIVLGDSNAAKSAVEQAIAANAGDGAFVAEMKSALEQLKTQDGEQMPAGEAGSENNTQ